MSTTTEIQTVPKVGDILVSAWGYDQTNIDFYKVVKATEKSVWLQPIKQQIVQQTGSLSETVVPLDTAATDYAWNESGERVDITLGSARYKIHISKNSGNYFVRLNSFSSAYLWNGKPMEQTHYH